MKLMQMLAATKTATGALGVLKYTWQMTNTADTNRTMISAQSNPPSVSNAHWHSEPMLKCIQYPYYSIIQLVNFPGGHCPNLNDYRLQNLLETCRTADEHKPSSDALSSPPRCNRAKNRQHVCVNVWGQHIISSKLVMHFRLAASEGRR